ncbi:hypothetical protein [Allorhizocola rhizosphaerae]|uniref:hypothetical protein n=1 Tax=Allorhizocola rhizosphaerae TaxID=1872709 RepID=UPI000E3B7C54|nr:hypothetical protein [Allorhizocola rhizosphaerae]
MQTADYVYFRAPDAAAALALASSSGPAPGSDVVQANRVEPVINLGLLVSIAESVEWTPDLVAEDIITPDSELDNGDSWVSELADEGRDSLARIDDARIPELVDAWAEIEEWAGDIDAEFLRSVLTELIALARHAQTANDHLYVWTSR